MAKRKKNKRKKRKLPLVAPLGFSPAQKTASGAGPHGGGKKEKNKRGRKKAKQKLRGGSWD